MLYIVASYHCMQFQEKRFFSNFAYLAEIRAAIFFLKIWLFQTLDIMVSYHHVQYQKKQMIQS